MFFVNSEPCAQLMKNDITGTFQPYFGTCMDADIAKSIREPISIVCDILGGADVGTSGNSNLEGSSTGSDASDAIRKHIN
eukprot:10083962-Ditylum_brightwellii.AAC.1